MEKNISKDEIDFIVVLKKIFKSWRHEYRI